MSNWTDEQLDAIEARNTGIIVSAAAGSGKTSVLVERLIRILSDTENRTPADRLVVVTFTNDAAAQMKRRLYDALSERIAADPDDMWLRSQQSLLQAAKISTIHSFCFDLIRENIRSLGVSSGFRILDDTEEHLLIRKAVDNAFEILYEEQPDMTEAAADFFSESERSDKALEEMVITLYKFLVSMPFYEDWLKKQTALYSAGFNSGTDPLAAVFLEHIRGEYVRFRKKAAYANDLSIKELGGPVPSMENDMRQFDELIAKIDDTSKSWDERLPKYDFVFDNFDAPKVPKEERGTKEQKSPKEKIRKIIHDIRGDKKSGGYVKDYEKIKKSIYTEAEIIDDYKKHAEILGYLTKIIEIFINELDILKAEKNALSFSDAEQLAIKLLAEKDPNGQIVKTPLAKELEDYYSVIMIDEFQDANNAQDLIFKMLSRDGTAERGGTDLFTVGDVKQSIYRFRQANPGLFLDALEKSESYVRDGFSGTNAAILLNKNFRSSSDVVDFVNFCFRLLMSSDVGDVDYDASQELVQGLEYPDGDRSTEFIIVPAEQSGTDGTADDELDESVAACEARAAAEKISSMLGVRTVLDKGGERPCQLKDFCILMRDKKNFDTFVSELAAFGIPAHAEEPDGYLLSREISVLTSMLAVIDNPMQDIKLASVLMSPMFMLTAEDMAQLACAKKEKERYFTVIKSVLDGDTGISEKSALYVKLDRFMQTFNKLRYCAASQTPERLIRTIYDSTDFLSAVQVFKDGSRKRANLRYLLSLADSYEKNSGGGLSGFVRYIDNIIRRGKDLKQASAALGSEDTVSIMTMHGSKGLEYPFVFICGTSVGFNYMDLKKRVQADHECGIGFKIQDRKNLRLYDSFPQDAIKEINRSNLKSEEMRLLYVALTRAREQLFITVPENKKIKKRMAALRAEAGFGEKIDASAANSMLDWLAMAMMRHPAGDWFRDDETLDEQCDVRVRVEEYVPAERDDTAAEEEALTEPDETSVSRLKEMFSFVHDDILTKRSAKITVTEIAKSEDEDKIYLRRLKFDDSKGGLTAAERGTAMHTFMQYADYSAAETDPDAEADRLADNGLLTPEERDSLDIDQLNVFFGSDLYSQIKSSGMVRREQKFLIKKSDAALDDSRIMEYNDNSMIQGIADCLFEKNGGLVLVDYKTDNISKEETFIAKYDLQLKLYSAALGRIFGKKVTEAYLYSFKLGKAIQVL
ncbi:MAG: helicase-exonuclease AddAB subunit AddA [Oscillospiraceae bacterium]|nr:helicase-exonuclease AddAB subunit AddA [Oscillospiraceae bacterium]